MHADHVTEVLDGLDRAGVRYWVGGGWGVVALTGLQTREHRFHAGIETGFLTSVDILIDGAVRAARRGTAR